MMFNSDQIEIENDIALIGMACRLPGANNPDIYWENILNKKESITFFSEEDLLKSNILIDKIRNQHYVPARGILNDIDKFDASFFGYSPFEAKLMDPQHRVFLEEAWTALENAGYNPEKFAGAIGVFAGMGDSQYLVNNLLQNSQIHEYIDEQHIILATSSHFLSTKVAYAMGLTGPCITVNTACSSSLVAIALACESLTSYNCDMALAGGITIIVPQQSGYLYRDLGILSPDGHCRAFDNNAKGTVLSNGCGIVVLKRLADALNDKDNIIAVIKGWAVNNDGANKAGFTAPSVQGQTVCVKEAIAHAEITSTEVEYLEAHGTGTLIGDPIEITALSGAYGYEKHRKQQYCALGSVKPNIGHTDIAAGVAGFIKAALALREKVIPPSINYATANLNIDFTNSPFYINCEAKPWEPRVSKRTAAVNSLGFGGTNAHVILQEAPEIKTTISNSINVLILSAKTIQALDATTSNLYDYLLTLRKKNKELNTLADVAYTLQIGRKHFKWRRAISYTDYENLLDSLSNKKQLQLNTQELNQSSTGRIIFGFPGQGTQYVNMAVDIYHEQPFFKQIVDEGCEYLKKHMDFDLREILFLAVNTQDANEKLQDTQYAQPALFIIEYALSQLMIKLGIKPHAMIGHSLGEYVAATLAGVLTLENALKLISIRANLMAKTSPGVMLAIPLSAEKISPLLTDGISLAAQNAPNLCVISGKKADVEKFKYSLQPLLEKDDLSCNYLHTSHAFHSASMDAILDEFRNTTHQSVLHSPLIPYISNVTGNWITDMDLNNENYWSNHLRNPILFSKGVECLDLTPNDIFVEIGPGNTLIQLVKQHQKEHQIPGISLLPSAKNITDNSYQFFLQSIGKLWLLNQEIKWENLYLNENRKRIPLPTYPFERVSYWINPSKKNSPTISHPNGLLYTQTWERDIKLSSCIESSENLKKCWLIFCTQNEHKLFNKLNSDNKLVYIIKIGKNFQRISERTFTLDPGNKQHYETLLKSINLSAEHCIVLHAWLLNDSLQENTESVLQKGTYSLLYLSQAFTENCPNKSLQVLVLANDIYNVLGNEKIQPNKSTILGPCKVIPLEQENIQFKLIDLEKSDFTEQIRTINWEANHFNGELFQNEIAYRGDYRWLKRIQPCTKHIETNKISRLKHNGIYLISGGLGGIGLTLAMHLAKNYKANLILITRSDLLPEEKWSDYIKHPTNQKILKQITALKEIKKEASSLLIQQAYVENEEQMSSVVQTVMQKFGRIDGVIHAAGVPGEGVAQLKTVQEYNKVLQPKLHGTKVLVKLLQNQPMDFMVFVSSVTAISGFPGQVDYCSANLALDAYAISNPFKHPVFCVTMNWESWREVGMAADSKTKLINLDESNSVSPATGVQLFEAILNSNLNQVIISSRHPNAIPIPKIENRREEKEDKIISQQELETSDEIIKIVLDIWRQILEIPTINLDDDFYELGGNSLLAISLITKILHKFNLKIPASVLFKAKTVRELADIIRFQKHEKEHASLVILQDSIKDTLPSFMIHPIGGTVFCYLPLVQSLKQDRKIYGLQDPSIEEEQLLFRSIEEMATYYLQIIQEIQPKGPYYLCGASFGATVVMEIAYQLLEKKQEVNFVGLFDGWAAFSQQQKDTDYVKSLMLSHQQDPTSYLLPKEADNLSLWEEMLKHRLKLMLSHKLKKVDTQITLFKASEILSEYKEIDAEENHWSPYSTFPIKIHKVPGDHHTMLHKPNAVILAEYIQKYLK